MTAHEQIKLVVDAIQSAVQIQGNTRVIKIYRSSANGLNQLTEGELHNILYYLQDNENVLSVESTSNTTNLNYIGTAKLQLQEYCEIRLIQDNFNIHNKQFFTRTHIRFNIERCTLEIGEHQVRWQPNSKSAELVKILFGKKSKSNKKWHIDEIYEKLNEPMIADKNASKKKLYGWCDSISKKIAKETGVNDLLQFDTRTVKINPIYKIN